MSRYCSIVLNAHVPWVRHPEVDRCLEEDWLHSSVLETHLPLLEMLFRLRDEGVPYHLTLNLSPTLLAMLRDRLLKRRTLAYLDRTLKLLDDEVARGDITGHGELAQRYRERFQRVRTLYVEEWKCDLIGAFADLRDSGHLELTASAATHGLLPLLMRVPENVQAQIRAGIRQYVQCFGRMPRGFWLPECAYTPALSRMLKLEGIDWTIVEEHGLTTAAHADESLPYHPVTTPEDLVIFGRAHAASSEIWSADEGFPGDERYRNFMKDIGLEAPIEYLREYLGDSDQRQFTGIKYHALSGENDLYDPELASHATDEHALRFVASRGAQLAALEAGGVEHPIVLCAFDTDLFGHWWYEGTEFLEKVLRNVAERGDFSLTTPGNYLAAHKEATFPQLTPCSSSWGEGGYFETWTEPENDWIHAELQIRASQFARFARLFQENRAEFPEETQQHRQRCMRLLTRELLLAQSSDWGFLMLNSPSREYAEKRTREHLANFDRIWEVTPLTKDDGRLTGFEDANPIFPDLPWNLFEPYQEV